MLLSKDPFPLLDRFLLHRRRFLELTDVSKCDGEIAHRRDCLRMLLSKDPFPLLDRLLLHQRRFLELAEISERDGEVTHRRDCVGMLFPTPTGLSISNKLLNRALGRP